MQVLNKKNNKNIRLDNINDSFIKELMSVGVGEEVPEEYVPMMKEELSIDAAGVRDENVEKLKLTKIQMKLMLSLLVRVYVEFSRYKTFTSQYFVYNNRKNNS